MDVKVAEDLPKEVAQYLRAHGHDARSVSEQAMGGWTDATIWEAIQAEARFLVTADKGIADVREHPPGSHAGVLLLRPDEYGIPPLIALLTRVLECCALEELSGIITVATPRGIRVRR